MRAKESKIHFHKEEESPTKKKKQTTPNMKLLSEASDSNVSLDLMISLQFQMHITQTDKRLDVVM